MKIIKIIAYIIVGFITLFIALGLIGAFFSSDTAAEETTTTNEEVVKEEPKILEPEKPTYLWEYSENVDEMDGKKNYFAVLVSDNQLNFDFPYNGGSSGIISIRNMNGKNTIALRIETGQFMSNFNGSEYIRIKFDDAVLESYNFGTASDGSSDIIFPSLSNKIIDKFKKAKKVKIEAPFYNEGRKVLNFSTEGLVWDK